MDRNGKTGGVAASAPATYPGSISGNLRVLREQLDGLEREAERRVALLRTVQPAAHAWRALVALARTGLDPERGGRVAELGSRAVESALEVRSRAERVGAAVLERLMMAQNQADSRFRVAARRQLDAIARHARRALGEPETVAGVD